MGIKFVGGTPPKHDFTDHLVAEPVKTSVEVTKTVAKAKPITLKSEEATPATLVSSGPMAQVSVGGSRKYNLGNYESAEIRVQITIPCPKDTIEETYSYASDWVSSKIADIEKDIKA